MSGVEATKREAPAKRSNDEHFKSAAGASRARAAECEEQPPPLALVPERGHFEGLVAFRGETILEGAVEGCIEGDGRLVLTRAASVNGEIEVDRLHLAGRVSGRVRARRLVVLESSAQLHGRLETPFLVVDDGALLDAVCHTTAAAVSEGRAIHRAGLKLPTAM